MKRWLATTGIFEYNSPYYTAAKKKKEKKNMSKTVIYLIASQSLDTLLEYG